MKKIYWYIIAIVCMCILAYIKYNYDQKEQQRVNELNQRIRNDASFMSGNASKELNNGFGESEIDGLKEIKLGDSE